MPHVWTPECVEEALVAAFRIRGGVFVPSPGEVEKQLNWRTRFLRDDPQGWTYFMFRARCLAARESIQALRRERNWKHWQFENGWRRARDTVVAGLNLERINAASLSANEDAEERLIRRGRIQVVTAAPSLYLLTSEKLATDQ